MGAWQFKIGKTTGFDRMIRRMMVSLIYYLSIIYRVKCKPPLYALIGPMGWKVQVKFILILILLLTNVSDDEFMIYAWFVTIYYL